MTRAALRCAAPALVLAAAVLLPFLDKAFTIDDTMFLRQAEHLLTDPLHPTAFEMVWSAVAAPVRNSAIMPSGPAMAYLLVPCVRSRTLSRAILGATVVAGVVLGLLIIRADAAFSGLGRRAAKELIAPQVAAGRNVWFAGHWGFQWYAEKAGARCLTMTPPLPLRGDLAVSSLNSMGSAINLFPKRKLLATLEDSTPGGRIMDKSLGSGFYSNPWGYLPWAWGDDVLDRFSLWQLE